MLAPLRVVVGQWENQTLKRQTVFVLPPKRRPGASGSSGADSPARPRSSIFSCAFPCLVGLPALRRFGPKPSQAVPI